MLKNYLLYSKSLLLLLLVLLLLLLLLLLRRGMAQQNAPDHFTQLCPSNIIEGYV